jgi:endonuclease G
LRKDGAERKDNWLRDNRIDTDAQLNDAYYSKSGFDKGYMSRREDADWDADPLIAKRDADMTCMYTNACQQVPTINRSNKHGLWGQLEKIVLENGVKKENGKTGNICVYTDRYLCLQTRFTKASRCLCVSSSLLFG